MTSATAIAGQGKMAKCAFLVCIGVLSAVAALAQLQDTDRQNYSRSIGSDYNYRFGHAAPFAPGNAAIEGNEFIQPGSFPTAEYCAHCHKEAYRQWREALHSNAFRAPFYPASVNRLIDTKGIEYARQCDSCHNPIGLLSGALTEKSKVDRKFDEDGVTCMFAILYRASSLPAVTVAT